MLDKRDLIIAGVSSALGLALRVCSPGIATRKRHGGLWTLYVVARLRERLAAGSVARGQSDTRGFTLTTATNRQTDMTLKTARQFCPRGYCKERFAERFVRIYKEYTASQRRRKEEAGGLRDFLTFVCVIVPAAQILKWDVWQWAMAEEWAAQVHLSASDNAFIRIPPRPSFLPADKPMTWQANAIAGFKMAGTS